MRPPYVIREFGRIYRGQGPDRFDAVWLPPRSFDLLQSFVAEQGASGGEVDRAFRYGMQKGVPFIQVRNHVGIIHLQDGTQLEILPKLLGHLPEAKEEAILKSRRTFLHMLRHLRDSPFIALDQAQLKAARFPVLEVFIGAFLSELDQLVREGLQASYSAHTANQRYLKGRLEVGPHLQRNLLHPERFLVTFDTYALDTPWHRLLKRALLLLRPLTRALPNQRLLQRLTFVFDEVAASTSIEADWQRLDFTDRQYRRYHRPMRWARVFLQHQSFTNFSGSHQNLALLFPMERIFEDFVGHQLRQNMPGWSLSQQDRRHHLVERFAGRRAFGLRPDFVLSHPDGRVIVADAKWKRLDAAQRHPPLGISQADLYQLYAYGHKYRPAAGPFPTLWLLYPEQVALASPHHLRFEEGLEIEVKSVSLG